MFCLVLEPRTVGFLSYSEQFIKDHPLKIFSIPSDETKDKLFIRKEVLTSNLTVYTHYHSVLKYRPVDGRFCTEPNCLSKRNGSSE